MEKKEKRRKGEKIGQVKPTGKGLEGFVDWVNPTLPIGETQDDHPTPQISNEPVEESEHDISSLAIAFVKRMCK